MYGHEVQNVRMNVEQDEMSFSCMLMSSVKGPRSKLRL